MPGIFAGKNALVTGAGRRLGREIALALAGEGCNIILHYHDSEEDAREVAALAGEKGVTAWTLKADLAKPGQAASLLPYAMDTAGAAVDFLVNNASIFPQDSFFQFGLSDLYENINVNAFAPLVLMRMFAEQKRPGVIVNLLDCRIVDYDRMHVPYHISKRILHDFTRMAAMEFAPRVRVNAVAPGLILPPEGEGTEYLRKLSHTNLLQAYGGAEDVTDAVIYLLRAKFVTGEVMFVDGGRNLRGSFYG